MKNKEFTKERFVEWAGCNPSIWEVPLIHGELSRLLDHPFIADKAPVWSKGVLEGHEIAIISRTYCSRDEIDNPPNGLWCWRLPLEIIGANDIGTPIATVITGNSPAANMLLASYTLMPVDMFAFTVPRGYRIVLKQHSNSVIPTIFEQEQMVDRP